MMNSGAPLAGANASTTPSAPSLFGTPQNTTPAGTGFNVASASTLTSSSWGTGFAATPSAAPGFAPAPSPFDNASGPAAAPAVAGNSTAVSTNNASFGLASAAAGAAVSPAQPQQGGVAFGAPAAAPNPFSSAAVAPATTTAAGGKTVGFSFGTTTLSAPTSSLPTAPAGSKPEKTSSLSNPSPAAAPSTTASLGFGQAGPFAAPVASSSISFSTAPPAGTTTDTSAVATTTAPTTNTTTAIATNTAATTTGAGPSSTAPLMPTPAPTASLSESKAEAAVTVANFTGKTLSKILGAFDKRFYNDQKDFMELSKHVVLRDRHLMEHKLDLISISHTIKGALSAINSTKSVLRECTDKQKAMDRLLQGLEEAVDPMFQRIEVASASFSADSGAGAGMLRNADSTRYAAFQHATGIYDELMGLQSKLDVAVRQHRYDFEETRGQGELDRVMGLVAGQLSALESCRELAVALEKELDKLLGATYNA